MIPVFTGKVDKKNIGVFIPFLQVDSLQRLGQYINGLDTFPVDIVIRKHKSQRSLNQNSAYWGIAIEILSNCEAFGGYTKEEIHDALRSKFLSTLDPNTGLTKIRSTTDLNTVEFNQYYEVIQRWAAEFLNVNIPSPNEIPLNLSFV